MKISVQISLDPVQVKAILDAIREVPVSTSLHTAYTTGSVVTVPEPAPESTNEPEPPPAATVSADVVREAMVAFSKARSTKEAIDVLTATTGVSKVKDVDPSDYPALLAALTL